MPGVQVVEFALPVVLVTRIKVIIGIISIILQHIPKGIIIVCRRYGRAVHQIGHIAMTVVKVIQICSALLAPQQIQAIDIAPGLGIITVYFQDHLVIFIEIAGRCAVYSFFYPLPIAIVLRLDSIISF